MATLDEYWKQTISDPRFKDLDPEKQEKVRQRFFDQQVASDSRYSSLPQSKRLIVKGRFDETTKIPPTSMLDDVERKVKPIIQKGKEIATAIPPAAEKGVIGAEAGLEKVEGAIGKNKLVRGAVEAFGKAEDVAEKIEPAPVRIGYKGMKMAAGGIKLAGETIGNALEPNYQKVALTDFDVARAIASGAVKTTGEFVAGILPTSTPQTALYLLMEGTHKYAGTTFLGEERHLPGWKPKTGLSAADNTLGSGLEKAITQENINQHVRSNIDAMKGGPPAPLEVLGHKEEMLKAQDQINGYEEWLKQADDLNAKGGEPSGDLHPEAKVNVSQLRDAAKERLQRLQDEPVRVESLSKAEDALQGYYRRRIDQARVWMQPEASVPRETQAMLPEGPKPAGLLKAGEKTKPMPERPAEPTPAPNPITPGSTAAPAKTLPKEVPVMAKDVLTEAYSAYHPEATKQAIGIRVGAAMKSLRDELGIDVKNPLKSRDIDTIGMFLEQEHADLSTKEALPNPKKASNMPSEMARLKEKGLDPLEVQAEAKRLQAEHDAQHLAMAEGRAQLKDVTGGVALNQPDPMTGKIPEAEEIRTGIPKYLRGTTPGDQAAQMAHDAGIIPEPTLNALIEHARKFEGVEPHRSAKSFLDEAEYRLEMQNHQEAGFKPEPKQEVVPGTPGAQMPKTGLSGAEGQVPQDALLESFKNQDIQQKPLFDIVSDIGKDVLNKLQGEGGGFNTEDFDPARQAALEANIKELVSRARALGYETTQDIMLYAARNAPKELQNSLRKNLAPTLSPFDSHAYKEVGQAKSGNPIARQGLMDRAMRDYLSEKMEWGKGKMKSLSASKQILSFKDADEYTMRLKEDLYLFDTYRGHSKAELAAQRWYNEGAAPKLESVVRQGISEDEAKEMLRLYREPSDRMKAAKPSTQYREDNWHRLFSEHYDDLGYVENHVTRRWKQPQQYQGWEGQTLQGRANFFKGRKLITQAQGMDAGYDPQSLDIRDDIKASNEMRVTLLSRIHALTKMALTTDNLGRGSIIDEAIEGAETQARKARITPHKGQAPSDWIRVKGVGLLRDLAINPQYKPAIDYMMSQRFKGWGAEWMDYLAGLSKGTRLSLSLFHPASLTEMLLTGSSWRSLFSFSADRNLLFKTAKLISDGATAALDDPLNWKNPLTKEGRIHNSREIGRLYDSYMKGSAVLGNRSMALSMSEAGFKFGGMEEDVKNHISSTISRYEDFLKNRIKMPGRPQDLKYYKEALETAQGLRQAHDMFQKGLWGYMHQGFSMALYENQLSDNIMKFNISAPEGTKIPISKIESDTANFVHKEMGGISYAKLMITPRMQQVLQWALLAPAWTIGRGLMGIAMFEKGPEGRQARKQALRMAVAYGITANVANYASTKAAFGKGRWLHENPEDQKLNVFWKLTPNHEELYLQGSKASTEIWDDINHPARTLARKTSGPVQAAVKVMDWATAPTDRPYLENPLKAAAGMFMPGSFSGMSAYSTLPVRKGVSPASVARLFDKFYETGNDKYYEEAVKWGSEAGINWETLARSAQARSTSKKKRIARTDIFQ